MAHAPNLVSATRAVVEIEPGLYLNVFQHGQTAVAREMPVRRDLLAVKDERRSGSAASRTGVLDEYGRPFHEEAQPMLDPPLSPADVGQMTGLSAAEAKAGPAAKGRRAEPHRHS